MADRNGDWIQTFTGRKFYPFDPRPEDIDILDIAHALSMLCRFTGHCKVFYSVATHSVLVSQHCDPQDAFWGLLHDASEAYLLDMARPVKRFKEMKFYKDAEQRLMECVCERYGLSKEQPISVTQADNLLLATEARDLMSPLQPGWVCVPENGYPILADQIVAEEPAKAKSRFLLRFAELSRQSH